MKRPNKIFSNLSITVCCSAKKNPVIIFTSLLCRERGQTGLVCTSAVEDYFGDVIKSMSSQDRKRNRTGSIISKQREPRRKCFLYRDVKKSMISSIVGKKMPRSMISGPMMAFSIPSQVIDDDTKINGITTTFASNVPPHT